MAVSGGTRPALFEERIEFALTLTKSGPLRASSPPPANSTVFHLQEYSPLLPSPSSLSTLPCRRTAIHIASSKPSHKQSDRRGHPHHCAPRQTQIGLHTTVNPRLTVGHPGRYPIPPDVLVAPCVPEPLNDAGRSSFSLSELASRISHTAARGNTRRKRSCLCRPRGNRPAPRRRSSGLHRLGSLPTLSSLGDMARSSTHGSPTHHSRSRLPR